jgi:single-stranded-DNA-specific exonuclease
MHKSKKWIMPYTDKQTALRISEKLNVSYLAARVLCARGYSYEDAKDFLSMEENNFYDPFLLNDMQKAVDRIKYALSQNEKIAVYGDYDVDGITATYLLFDYLKSLGADAMYYIPDRIDEGYGMNTCAIDTLKKENITLIITVDLGITAFEEVDYAKDNGIDIIVTDHHSLKDSLPDALAIINPKITGSGYPFPSLAGVGVAFKLVYALSGLDKNIFYKYCDIAAIGTIADMVSLKSENRYIASIGINKLRTTENYGLKALMDISGIDYGSLSSSDISFAIAPRLNAAGRMSKANLSVELLLQKSYSEALKKAQLLDNCNSNRQKEEQVIFSQALEIIEKNAYDKDDFILVANKGWTHGIIGIVSSKITEKYYKPSAIVSINPDGTGKASGRSIKGLNLFNLLSMCEENLLKYGGHELAAGFTVKDNCVDSLRNALNERTSEIINEDILTPKLGIDAVINLSDINIKTIESLSVLEPYGIENSSPVFCIEDVRIKSIRYTQDNKHAFVTVVKDGCTCELPAFGMCDSVENYSEGEYISVAGILNINVFRGNTRAQFIVRDIHSSPVNNLINRDELEYIFKGIRAKLEKGNNVFDKSFYVKLSDHSRHGIKSRKFKIALDIFDELEILNIEKAENSYIITKGKNYYNKTNLELSKTFKSHSL